MTMISRSSAAIKTWANTLLRTNIVKTGREDEGGAGTRAFSPAFSQIVSLSPLLPINPVSLSPGKLLKMDIAWLEGGKGSSSAGLCTELWNFSLVHSWVTSGSKAVLILCRPTD